MESELQNIHNSKNVDASSEEEFLVPLDAAISLDLWKDRIFPFVGPGNYRFLGSVNKQFRSLYLEIYSTKTTTYKQIITIEQAQLFCHDIQNTLPRILNFHQMLSCRAMARLGRQEILEYFHSHQFAWYDVTCTAAAEGGHLKLLQWLHERNRAIFTNDICEYAAANGDIPMLQWLREQDCVLDTSTCSVAALCGHLNTLQWLRMKECPWDEETPAEAAENGHLHVIQWAHSEGCLWDHRTLCNAVIYGHLDVLVFALDHDCPTDDDDNLCRIAASCGQLEILQYLHERGGFVLDISVISCAAQQNCFEIVKWLYSVNCPWDASVCLGAARSGNLEMLQWLRARHCPWDKRVYSVASLHKCTDMLQWVHENGCPRGDFTNRVWLTNV